ncbi:MAG: hypothetical protein H7146_14565 [Burkholderiaceae bacterium]|nr:hypothetical protein [Microbacteriaceae bacterium]
MSVHTALSAPADTPAMSAPAAPPRPATIEAARIRVAAIPAAHPYVRSIAGDEVTVLGELIPDSRPAGQWWPPVRFDAAWITAHADEFDLMHLHFGTESFDETHLTQTVTALRGSRRPLVYTVHDLSHPQLGDQLAHERQLDILVRAANSLVTLTRGAAAAIRERWGREAAVIAHPNVFPLGAPFPATPARREITVGVHLRDLRPNIDAEALTAELADAAAELRAGGIPVTVRIDVHERVRDAGALERLRGLCEGRDGVDLRVRPRPDDDLLATELAGLDACVLPYRHGSHSGWLELCWDLGVPVLAPDLGFFADQHAGDPTIVTRRTGQGLAGALRELLDSAGATRAGTAQRAALQEARRTLRRAERQSVSADYTRIYAAAITRARP